MYGHTAIAIDMLRNDTANFSSETSLRRRSANGADIADNISRPATGMKYTKKLLLIIN
jgi:hypothetical protein